MKRIFLFILTNLAVMAVITIIASILGISGNPNNLMGLLAFSALVGFSGSIISLMMSKWVAKKSTGAQVIEQPANEMEAWLLNTVHNQAMQLGLKTPEVAIYDAPEPNAFATGPSKNNSLVAVSTGLMHSMTRDEVEAVLAHEVAHVANGDMVTMTLIQGVVNTFVYFLASVVANIVSSALSSNNEEEGEGYGSMAYFAIQMVLQLVFGFLASFIVMWFSRKREYRADAGAAQLVGAPKMMAALERLKGGGTSLPPEMNAMGISGGEKDSLLSTHPTLDNRIAALQQLS